MKVVPFRIPKLVLLPGLSVRVKEVHGAEIEGADGEWDYDTEGKAVIRIRRNQAIVRKRYILIHEMQHVMVDYLHIALQEYGKWIAVAPYKRRRVKKARGFACRSCRKAA